MALKPTKADVEIKKCIDDSISFSVIAGAGSGKTTSLITALKEIKAKHGAKLLQNSQRVVCVTYTKRAVEVISQKLGHDNLYFVTTLHSFLWGEVSRFTDDIRAALEEKIIPDHIKKAEDKDNGGNSKAALKARNKAAALKADLLSLKDTRKFVYDDSVISNYAEGILNHDDIIAVASFLITNRPMLRKAMGFKYPYIFVDEAQDTFEIVMTALNSICAQEGLPIIGYFGDPMQQIYDDGRAGAFSGPPGSKVLTKTENFRCSKSVIGLLNKVRDDVEQYAAGENSEIEGSVELMIVPAEEPEGHRKRYTDEQLDRATAVFEQTMASWGWLDNEEVKTLFLVRQMIARRLKFSNLHKLFTGTYSSSRSQSDYESGVHHLLKPYTQLVSPLVSAYEGSNPRAIIDILRMRSPSFKTSGKNKNTKLSAMIVLAEKHAKELSKLWRDKSVRDVLVYVTENDLFEVSDRLIEHLNRKPRAEKYDAENDEHSKEKSDWLADEFLSMSNDELRNYTDFVNDNTPYSTQHGVKGEEYPNVLVVIDDVEAGWNIYSFGKTLTPNTVGAPTDGQRDKTSKLAYVCFSRAEINLKIMFFSQTPQETKAELIKSGLFTASQISIL